MDLHVEFKNASKYQARELFNRFYLPTNTSAMEDDAEERDDETDSGYDSSSEKSDPKPVQSEESPERDLPFTGTTHTVRAPKMSRVRITKLAERFAEAIPDRECSMASLQGYLMAYKTRPVEAADEAKSWVESERADRIANASEKEKERMEKEEREKKEKEEKEKKDREEKEKKEKEEEKVGKEAVTVTEESVTKPMLSTDRTSVPSLPSPVTPTTKSLAAI